MKLSRISWILLCLCLGGCESLNVSETQPQPQTPGSEFPSFESLRPPVLLEPDPVVTVDRHGNYVIDGKPRFLVGTIYYAGSKMNYTPTEGYDDAYRWIYEEALDYENAQRLGFDSLGTVTPVNWMNDYYKNYTNFFWPQEEYDFLKKAIGSARLPLYVDFTCAGWAHGNFARKQFAPYREKGVLNVGGSNSEGNHWVPYSVNHPQGREMYFKMWETGVKYVKDSGGKALFYELFNEPAYNDRSALNKRLFAERMKANYGSIETLNQVWRSNYKSFDEIAQFETEGKYPGMAVDWGKFMEDSFVDLCREGVKRIRALDTDPNVGVCVQSLGWGYRVVPRTNINLFKLSEFMNTTSASTGGGSALHVHYLRSISRGKAIHDGEAYVRKSKKGIKSTLWKEVSRGMNASYLFKWSKRGWDWKVDGEWTGDEEAGKRLDKRFSWLMLNPYSMPTSDLTGMMEFKEELLTVDDFFARRDRNIKRDVALLISYPTERWSYAVGAFNNNSVLPYADALEYSHYPFDVILEEQMPKGRQDEYKMIVAAGVNSIYPETVSHLTQYVKDGGILVLGEENMQNDEYGHPVDWKGMVDLTLGEQLPTEVGTLEVNFPQHGDYRYEGLKAKSYRSIQAPKSWKPMATLNGKACIFKKEVGQGAVYYIGAKLSPKPLKHLLGSILQSHALEQNCVLSDWESGDFPDKIEVHKSVQNSMAGYFLVNRSSFPQIVKFKAKELQADNVALVDPINRLRHQVRAGETVFALSPGEYKVVVAGNAEALRARYPETTRQRNRDTIQRGKRLINAALEKQKGKGETFSFPINLAKVKKLDVRDQANRSFIDRTPNDGKGGWTDQGANNSLTEVEWGEQMFVGVPFDIIRWDHNENRTCLVLHSTQHQSGPKEVTGIQVGEQVKALYFLHCSAWTARDRKKVMDYVLHHPGGEQTVIPIHSGDEIGDWWKPGKGKAKHAEPAWTNSQNRGFYVYRWENPNPEKLVESIDVVSANGKAIPIVIGVTAELE